MPDDQSQQPPPEGATVLTFHGSQLTYRTLLFNVFMHPKLAMALFSLGNQFWLLTLATLLLLSMLGGCGIAMSRVPDYAADIRRTTDFLLDTVGTITVHNGTLDWAQTNEGVLPATKRFEYLRVDIVENRRDFQLGTTGSADRLGLIVAHDGFRFWRYDRNAPANPPEATIPAQMLQNLPEIPLEPTAQPASEEANQEPQKSSLCLSRQTQPQICKLVFLSLFFSSAITLTIELGGTLLVSAFLIAVTIAFVIRIRQLRSFFALLLFTLNTTIPPAIAAIIYLIAELGSDFQAMFAIMLTIYTVYALIEGRNGTIVFPPSTKEPE